MKALEQSLELLERGGILSVCIYSGKDTGWKSGTPFCLGLEGWIQEISGIDDRIL